MDLLLIEDEPAIRSALARACRRWGHRVLAADSLVEGRKCAAEQPPDAIISDLKLPDGSGLDLCLELGVPFVLMSGYGNFDDAVVALRNGCVDFLTKPVALEQLKEAIQRIGTLHREAPPVICGPDPEQLQVPMQSAQTQVVSAQASSLVERSVHILDLQWGTSASAEALFLEYVIPNYQSSRLQQICAELMQLSLAQRLVINDDGALWRCWSPFEHDPASLSPDLSSQMKDRRQVIDALAHRCWWRPQGVVVERAHEA
ncbi:MAG: response regulator [Planctomycetota bacterium]|nr:MAG: response regulator [Planctomycetota bacterium]